MLLNLSIWGYKHPVLTRALMVSGHLLLVFLLYNISNQLHAFGIRIPGKLMFVFLSISLFCFLICPFDKISVFRPKFRQQFLKRKCYDFCFTFSAMLMTVCFFSDGYRYVLPAEITAAVIEKDPDFKYARTREILSVQKENPTHKISRSDKRILVKELKFQVRKFLNTPPDSKKEENKKIWLTILTIFLAIVLGLVLAALGCAIACNVAEVLGIVVAIGGVTLVIILAILIVRRINGKTKKKSKEPSNTTETATPESPPPVQYN